MYNPDKAHYVSHTLIIVKDGKFLITKRAPTEKAFPNMWTVPGGGQKLKDYDREPDTRAGHWYNVGELVCQREVLEEIGINVPVEDMKYVTSLAFKLPDGVPIFVNSYYTVFSIKEEDIKLSPELTEFKWVTLEEAKEYDLIPGIWEELEMVDRLLKGEKADRWVRKEA